MVKQNCTYLKSVYNSNTQDNFKQTIGIASNYY